MSDEKKSSWDEPRRAKFTHEEDVAFLRRAIEVSRLSREHGNTPFGAILVTSLIWREVRAEPPVRC